MKQAHSHGEQGVAIMVTALLLIPLMIFAAYGVDLASWYSRTSFLQKSADAASLAGTVWMPDIGPATTAACASLEQNGITGAPSCGSGPFEVTVAQGSVPTRLRVTVTDPAATRYFSQVMGSGSQRLTRSAEAEYNLPLPLGSPLNFFGGDRTTTDVPATFSYSVDWPAGANTGSPPSRRPAIAQVGETQQPFGCNVGASSAEGMGRWTSISAYSSTGFSGSQRCFYSVLFTAAAGTSNVPPPDYTRRAPTNHPCNVFQTSGANGRWTNATTFEAGNRYTSGAGFLQCTWNNVTTDDIPSWAATGNAPGSVPVNQPCRVGYDTTPGFWNGFYTAAVPAAAVGGNQSVGNRLCRWRAAIVTTMVTPPSNPIDPARSPGFWAQIEGPDTWSTNGDAYSPRCYTTVNCGSVENLQYEPPTDPDRGYWYVVRMPGTNVGPIDIRIFDANHAAGTFDTFAGDRNLGSGGNFNTTFRVWKQNSPLDFTDRTGLGPAAGDQTDGSCHWDVPPATGTFPSLVSPFRGAWRSLCTISSYNPGDFFLINVQTTGDVGNGVNGYGVEALAAGAVQPTVYAYADMGMYNINRCSTSGCTPPPATFYLAEVGPQYAGKTLVVELWDPGDVASGTIARMAIKRPSPSAPRPVEDVPAADCEYTSSPSPNPVQTGLDPTGATYATPQPSDDGTRCSVTTSTGSRRFNGTWVTLRVNIPPDYDCDLNTPATPINPEVDANSCWWGIEYSFGGTGTPSANDVTVWQARIEGNPVHLTE